MALLASVVFVFLAGLVTALATGIGALPFFLVDDVSDRVNVVLWGIASGIMVAASLFGLVDEGLANGTPTELGLGIVIGVVLVIVSHEILEAYDFDAEELATADGRKMVLILGILTVHSFPEGVAIGVSFGELGLTGGVHILGFVVPILAVFMTIAISIHNIPEGLAISIPLRAMGAKPSRMVGYAVFSSLPQPIGAVLAFLFVRIAQELLAVGFGFAAGAMVYLVISEFVPEALESGQSVPHAGYPEFIGGTLAGGLAMLPLLLVS
ncbi:MAG: ZIP family metal transporter [Halobacteriaceae archaeon]